MRYMVTALHPTWEFESDIVQDPKPYELRGDAAYGELNDEDYIVDTFDEAIALVKKLHDEYVPRIDFNATMPRNVLELTISPRP